MSPRSFYGDIRLVLQNRNYFVLLLGLFFLTLTIGTHETLGIHVVTFLWGLMPNQIGFLFVNNIIGVHVEFFLAAKLHYRLDKRSTIELGAVGLSVFWSVSVDLTLLGFAPASGPWPFLVFIVFWQLFVFFRRSAKYHRHVGTCGYCGGTGAQHGFAVGRYFLFGAGIFFESNERRWPYCCWNCTAVLHLASTKSVPREVSGDIIFRLGVVDGPFAIIGGVIAGIVYLRYRIDKSAHAEIQEQLKRRPALVVSES